MVSPEKLRANPADARNSQPKHRVQGKHKQPVLPRQPLSPISKPSDIGLPNTLSPSSERHAGVTMLLPFSIASYRHCEVAKVKALSATASELREAHYGTRARSLSLVVTTFVFMFHHRRKDLRRADAWAAVNGLMKNC
ncbi:hypothetical protein MTO96_012396 [Rhipicephalus appendiculatus]